MSEIGDMVSSKLAEYGIVPDRGEAAGAAASENPEMPMVQIVPVISTMAREIGGILSQNGVFVRQRSAMTISPEGRLVEMSARRFRTYCEEHLVTFKWEMPKPNVFEKKPQTITVEAAATICYIMLSSWLLKYDGSQ